MVASAFLDLAIFTGAKSFVDNPILGLAETEPRRSPRLASEGRAWPAGWRRRGWQGLPAELRNEFDRMASSSFATSSRRQFQRLRTTSSKASFRAGLHQQGDTLTRRVAVDPISAADSLSSTASSTTLCGPGCWPMWRALEAEPLYYVQTILGGVARRAARSATSASRRHFPSLDEGLAVPDGRRGRWSPADLRGRIASGVAGAIGLGAAQKPACPRQGRSAFGTRIAKDNGGGTGGLGLPQPTRFAVPGNTLVVIDTFGFHARGKSDRPTKRIEFGPSRRTPFLPWASGGLMSWKPIAARRARWLNSLGDWADRYGLAKQHWTAQGARRPINS